MKRNKPLPLKLDYYELFIFKDHSLTQHSNDGVVSCGTLRRRHYFNRSSPDPVEMGDLVPRVNDVVPGRAVGRHQFQGEGAQTAWWRFCECFVALEKFSVQVKTYVCLETFGKVPQYLMNIIDHIQNQELLQSWCWFQALTTFKEFEVKLEINVHVSHRKFVYYLIHVDTICVWIIVLRVIF